MSEAWTCTVCGAPVQWGEPVCPLCGSALEWQEQDEADPVGHLLPAWAEDEALAPARARSARLYAALALAAGVIMVIIAVAGGTLRWGWLVSGLLFAAAGGYGLLARRPLF